MCQLLGMNCNAPTDVTFSFRGFAQRGGNTEQHTDGWGIAFFEGGNLNDSFNGNADDKGLRHFVDHQPACTSPVAELISHRMRMNTFLGKWLEYLAERGHGVATLHRCDEAMSEVATAD